MTNLFRTFGSDVLQFASVATLLALLWVLMRRHLANRAGGWSWREPVLEGLILVHVAAVSAVTLISHGGEDDEWTRGPSSAHVNPFASDLTTRAGLTQVLGNAALFMPLIVLLLLRWPALRSARWYVPLAVLVPLAFETAQSLWATGRDFTLEDLLAATVGCLIAACGTAIIARRNRRVARRGPGSQRSAHPAGVDQR